jgi:hypothetical protein
MYFGLDPDAFERSLLSADEYSGIEVKDPETGLGRRYLVADLKKVWPEFMSRCPE